VLMVMGSERWIEVERERYVRGFQIYLSGLMM
jgi:hypothetical protein